MKITLNGEPRDLENIRTLADLVAHLSLEPFTLLIEHNTEPLRRDEWPTRHLTPGDRIELLRIAAGG